MVELKTLSVGDCFEFNNNNFIIIKTNISGVKNKYVKALSKDSLLNYQFEENILVKHLGMGKLCIEFSVTIEEAAKALKEYLGSTCKIVLIANNTLHVWYKDILNVPQPATYKGYNVKYYFCNMEEVFTLQI